MTNHAHLIILRDLKRHTAKALRHAIEENPQESRREWMLWMFQRVGRRNAHNPKYHFWLGSHPIELNTNDLQRQGLRYLHQNPVVVGFVDEPEDFLYSSVRTYAGHLGLVEKLYIG